MSRIFLSHSSTNNAEAVALRDWLAAQGFDEIFLDIDPNRGIKAGERWERALNEAAGRCEAVVFLLSRAWIASGWCRKEMNLAHHLNKRMFGVLIEDLPAEEVPRDLSGEWQLVRLASGRDRIQFTAILPVTHAQETVTFSAEGLQRLKHGLENAGLDPKYFAWPPADDPDRPPYRGFLPLEAEDAGIFFGRDAAIIAALDILRGLREAPPPRLFVILGASGAGKSSVLRAGLIPRLKRDDRYFLALPVIRPERAAITGEAGLLRALEAVLKEKGLARARADLRATLAAGPEAVRGLLEELAVKSTTPALADGEPPPKPPTLVLSIDQGEELFNADGVDEARQLLDLIAALVSVPAPDVIIVFAIRTDAYEPLQSAQGPAASLANLKQVTLSLPPMARGAYQSVIEGPAARLTQSGRKLDIAPDLTAALLRDIEEGGAKDALPLLAFTSERLYSEYGGDGKLTLAKYEALGGVKGSIEAAVELALKGADTNPAIPKDRNARLALLRRGLIPWLAGIDPDTGAPRRRIARLKDIPPESRPLIELLVDQRMLATDVDRDTGEATIEPAHEALLRQWGLLEGWLEEDFEDLATLEGVKRAARDWLANDERTAWISHTSGRLEEAERIAGRSAFQSFLEPTDRQYLNAARAGETQRTQRETLRQRRERRILRILTAGSLTVALVIASLAWLIYSQWKTSLKSQSQTFATLAIQETKKGDPTTGILIALEGLPDKNSSSFTSRLRPYVPELEFALDEAWRQRKEFGIASSPNHVASSAAFSSDGSKFTTFFWPETTEKQKGLLPLIQLRDSTTGYLISSTHGRLVTLRDDLQYAIINTSSEVSSIWHTNPWKLVAPLNQFATEHAVFSPDNNSLLVIGRNKSNSKNDDNAIELRDVRTGTTIRDIACGFDHTARFSRDGRLVFGPAFDNHAWICDVATGQLLHDIDVSNGLALSDVDVSVDRKYIATGSNDKNGRLWDFETGALVATLEGHEENVQKVRFSPDGKTLATTSQKSVRIWDVEARQLRATLLNQDEDMVLSQFIADGHEYITGSDRGTVQRWKLQSGAKLSTIRLAFLDHSFKSFSVGPKEKRIVAVLSDGTSRLYNMGENVVPIASVKHGREFGVSAGYFDANSTRFTTYNSSEGGVYLWDMAGNLVSNLASGTGGVCVAFSSNGKEVLIAEKSGTRIYSAGTGSIIRSFPLAGETFFAAFSSDGSRIVTLAQKDSFAQVWNARTGKRIAEVGAEGTSVLTAEFSADGARLLTAASDHVARIFDIATGQQLLSFSGHEDGLTGASFSSDNNLVVTSSKDHTARIWSANSGEVRWVLDGHSKSVRTASFSPDSSRVLTVSDDNTARVWDVASGEPIYNLSQDWGTLYSAKWGPVGRKIITGSWDGYARIWDSDTGEIVGLIAEPTRIEGGSRLGITGATISPDGKYILTTLNGPIARLWRPFETWSSMAGVQTSIDFMKAVMHRCLTQDQRKYLSGETVPPRWCITGVGLENERDPTKWQPKWPYDTAVWREWLVARDRGESPPIPEHTR